MIRPRGTRAGGLDVRLCLHRPDMSSWIRGHLSSGNGWPAAKRSPRSVPFLAGPEKPEVLRFRGCPRARRTPSTAAAPTRCRPPHMDFRRRLAPACCRLRRAPVVVSDTDATHGFMSADGRGRRQVRDHVGGRFFSRWTRRESLRLRWGIREPGDVGLPESKDAAGRRLEVLSGSREESRRRGADSGRDDADPAAPCRSYGNRLAALG